MHRSDLQQKRNYKGCKMKHSDMQKRCRRKMKGKQKECTDRVYGSDTQLETGLFSFLPFIYLLYNKDGHEHEHFVFVRDKLHIIFFTFKLKKTCNHIGIFD